MVNKIIIPKERIFIQDLEAEKESYKKRRLSKNNPIVPADLIFNRRKSK